jgi:hypothetical protein
MTDLDEPRAQIKKLNRITDFLLILFTLWVLGDMFFLFYSSIPR